MKFWWSSQILPATNPSSTSHTSIESIYSGLTTSMNGSCTHVYTRTHRPIRCVWWPFMITVCVCVFVFSGLRGFRRSRLRLKNLLRPKRKKGKRPIKVCFYTPTTTLMATNVLISGLIDLCVCLFAARSVKASGIGRLLVTILEATELKAAKPNGERG